MRPPSRAAADKSPVPEPAGVRIGFPQAEELSGTPWVGAGAAAALPVLERRIREGTDSYTPLLVFLGGSAVHGELCGIEDPEGRRIVLSDLDLGVVTARRIPLEDRERITAGLGDGLETAPAPRLGFYYRNDLSHQSPTPGMVETTRLGYVLYGDRSLLRSFRMPVPGRIPTWEARRLLANRVLEWAGALEETIPPLKKVYVAAKLLADGAAVRLLARRSYRGGGYAARAAAASGGGLPQTDRDRITAWTVWRLAPRWSETPLGEGIGRVAVSPALVEEVRGGIRSAVASVIGDDAVGRLFGTGGVRGRPWARSWKRWGRLQGSSLRRFGPREFLRTPRVLLWEAALEWGLGGVSRAAAILERLKGDRFDAPDRIRREIVELGWTMDREGVD